MDAQLASMPVIDIEVGRFCEVGDTLGGLDPRVQRKVLYQTAERVYKLDVLGRTA